MNVEIKFRWVLITIAIIIGLILVVFHSLRSRYQSEIDSVSTALYQSQTEVSEYKIKVGEMEESVAETQAIVVQKDSEILQLKDVKERLRALSIKQADLIGELNLRIEVLLDSVPPSDTIEIIKMPEGNYAKLPLHYPYKDQWLTTCTSINTQGISSMSFDMYNVPVNIVVGDKKINLFNVQDNTVAVTTPNPYVKFDKANVVVVDNQISPWWYVGGGAVGATAIIIGAGLLLGGL